MAMKTKWEYFISWFSTLFSSSGRIGRTTYGVSLIVCILLSTLILTSILLTQGNMSFFILLYIPIIWLALAQGAKRCHDLGNSGWFQWIPFYYFIMLLKEGDKKTNYYGESPKYRHSQKKTASENSPPSDTDTSTHQKKENSYSKYNKDYRKNYSQKY